MGRQRGGRKGGRGWGSEGLEVGRKREMERQGEGLRPSSGADGVQEFVVCTCILFDLTPGKKYRNDKWPFSGDEQKVKIITIFGFVPSRFRSKCLRRHFNLVFKTK